MCETERLHQWNAEDWHTPKELVSVAVVVCETAHECATISEPLGCYLYTLVVESPSQIVCAFCQMSLVTTLPGCESWYTCGADAVDACCICPIHLAGTTICAHTTWRSAWIGLAQSTSLATVCFHLHHSSGPLTIIVLRIADCITSQANNMRQPRVTYSLDNHYWNTQRRP